MIIKILSGGGTERSALIYFIFTLHQWLLDILRYKCEIAYYETNNYSKFWSLVEEVLEGVFKKFDIHTKILIYTKFEKNRRLFAFYKGYNYWKCWRSGPLYFIFTLDFLVVEILLCSKFKGNRMLILAPLGVEHNMDIYFV